MLFRCSAKTKYWWRAATDGDSFKSYRYLVIRRLFSLSWRRSNESTLLRCAFIAFGKWFGSVLYFVPLLRRCGRQGRLGSCRFKWAHDPLKHNVFKIKLTKKQDAFSLADVFPFSSMINVVCSAPELLSVLFAGNILSNGLSRRSAEMYEL